MKLKTLADMRTLIGHLPKATREKATWQHVAAELDKAAAVADAADVSVAQQMVLSLERVECRVGLLAGASRPQFAKLNR
jgi:hypothetical protein